MQEKILRIHNTLNKNQPLWNRLVTNNHCENATDAHFDVMRFFSASNKSKSAWRSQTTEHGTQLGPRHSHASLANDPTQTWASDLCKAYSSFATSIDILIWKGSCWLRWFHSWNNSLASFVLMALQSRSLRRSRRSSLSPRWCQSAGFATKLQQKLD